MSEELLQKLVEKVDTISSTVQELQAEVRGEKRKASDNLSETITKKIKAKETSSFRREYNKNQYQHNSKVKEALEQVEEALKVNDIEKAKKTVEEGKQIIDKRQKLIKLADREDDGWEVARCYLSDALAEDSEDEKRILRSRRQAASNKKRKAEQRKKNYSRENFSRDSDKNKFVNRSDFFRKTSVDTRNIFNSRTCYICGERRHLYASCPKIRNQLCNFEQFEYEEKDQNKNVVGNLKRSSSFWKNTLKASSYVQSIIEKGYFIPFEEKPPKFCAKNNLSSREHPEFVEEVINELLNKGCVREIPEEPYCCNPLTVAERNNKLRLVLDLRHVNKYIKENKFKYEDLKLLQKCLKKVTIL